MRPPDAVEIVGTTTLRRCVRLLYRSLAIVSSALQTASPSITVLLRDGTSVRMRPVTPADRDQLVRGFEDLSEAARYQRFFTPVARLSSTQLDYLTDIDHVDHFAWGAESIDGAGIAIARYVRTGSDLAEAAFTITDNYQGRGLGWQLFQSLAMIAADHQLSRFEMTMLADNSAMEHLARKAGAEFEPPTGTTVRAEVELKPALWSDLPLSTELRRLAASVGAAA